jgi:hypothetical protein
MIFLFPDITLLPNFIKLDLARSHAMILTSPLFALHSLVFPFQIFASALMYDRCLGADVSNPLGCLWPDEDFNRIQSQRPCTTYKRPIRKTNKDL